MSKSLHLRSWNHSYYEWLIIWLFDTDYKNGLSDIQYDKNVVEKRLLHHLLYTHHNTQIEEQQEVQFVLYITHSGSSSHRCSEFICRNSSHYILISTRWHQRLTFHLPLLTPIQISSFTLSHLHLSHFYITKEISQLKEYCCFNS